MADVSPTTFRDGIPVWVVPSFDGLTTAWLIVGVGARDETARTAGIAHLVEHLVMRSIGRVTIDHNAVTDVDSIQFFARGDAARVADFVERVCAAITALPELGEEVIESERRAVAAELGEGGETSGDGPLLRRFGARGVGLVDYGQPAHRSFTREQVRRFAESWMHRANTALVVAGELPEALRLELPQGTTPERAVVAPLELELPAWMPSAWAPLAISFELAGGSPGLHLLVAALLELRVMDELRHTRGLIYSVQLMPFGIDDGRNVVVMVLDPAQGDIERTLVATVDLIRELAEGRIAEADLDHVRGPLLDSVDDPAGGPGIAEAAAIRYLRGNGPLDVERMREVWATATVSELAELAAPMLDTLLVLAGTETLSEETVAAVGLRSRLTPPFSHGDFSFRDLVGRAMRDEVEMLSPRIGKGLRGAQLLVSSDALTLITGEEVREVPMREIAALGRQADGTLLFDLQNGWDLIVRPGAWRDRHGSIESFVRRVPPELVYERETAIDA